MDGGRILKSVKTSYAEYISNDRRAEIVREMMKQQHKAMFIALRDGKFDAVIEGAGSGQVALPIATATVQPRLAGRDASAQEAAVTTTAASVSVVSDLLERAAAVAGANSPAARPADLPPPPPKLLRDKAPSGTHRTALPATDTPPRAPATVAAPSNSPRTRSSVPASGGRRSVPAAGERRYAPTRPASVFGQARPQQGQSIFGEDLLSDKSLDEVILSYLAAELEGDKK
jgi:hypothetical protein